jgi:hypothetical protein
VKEDVEGGGEEHEAGDAGFAAEGVYGCGQICGEGEGVAVAGAALDGGPGAVGGLVEGVGEVAEEIPPVGGALMEGVALQTGALPAGKGGILER